MKRKEYKVKIENGEIKPLEPLDLSNVKEGIVIFFEPLEKIANDNKEIEKKIKALDAVVGMLSDLSDEDRLKFEEATKRRPFFKERNE